ncbi:helix-turn-helix transcriptional regulator, partial [Streptomyces sp. NPDC059506]
MSEAGTGAAPDLFASVDALLARVDQPDLPPPAERERLRRAAGLTQEQIAAALGVRRATVVNWESGKAEPRPPRREAYIRLLDGLAARYPAPAAAPAPPAPTPATAAPAPAPAAPA